MALAAVFDRVSVLPPGPPRLNTATLSDSVVRVIRRPDGAPCKQPNTACAGCSSEVNSVSFKHSSRNRSTSFFRNHIFLCLVRGNRGLDYPNHLLIEVKADATIANCRKLWHRVRDNKVPWGDKFR